MFSLSSSVKREVQLDNPESLHIHKWLAWFYYITGFYQKCTESFLESFLCIEDTKASIKMMLKIYSIIIWRHSFRHCNFLKGLNWDLGIKWNRNDCWNFSQVVTVWMAKGRIHWSAQHSSSSHVFETGIQYLFLALCCFKMMACFLTYAGFLILLRLAYLSCPILDP